MNSCVLIGNLTREPELKNLQANTVCNCGLAVNERIKAADGQWVDKPVFIDITAWGRQGEVLAEYCHKGTKVGLQGRLAMDQWTDRDGGKRSKIFLNVDRVELLGTRDQAHAASQPPAAAEAASRHQEPAADDEIPF